MKKRSCRRTGFEQEQHDRAIRVRKMTDAQLCAYLDELEAHNQPIVISQDELEKVINGFIDSLATRSGTGLRVSDATIRKSGPWPLKMATSGLLAEARHERASKENHHPRIVADSLPPGGRGRAPGHIPWACGG